MTLSILQATKDENIPYYTKKLDIGGKRLETPLYTLHDSLDSDVFNAQQSNIIFESWKSFDINTAKDYLKSTQGEIIFSQQINKKVNTLNLRNNLLFHFIQFQNFNSNPFNAVTKKILKFTLDSIDRYSNFLVTPILKFSQEIEPIKLVNLYIEYFKEFNSIAQTYNTQNKPVVIVLPKILSSQISKLVNALLKMDIFHFCFDFQGYSLSTLFPHFKEFLRSLYLFDKKIFNEVLIQSVNLNNPSNMNPNKPFPAHDLINPALATDIIGLNHIGRGGSKKIAKNSKKKKVIKTKRNKATKINLINPNNYCYHRISNFDEIDSMLPKSKLHIQKPTDHTLKETNRFRREFNFNQINFEFQNIQQKIHKNESISKYLLSKTDIKDEFNNKIMGTTYYIAKKRLEDFF